MKNFAIIKGDARSVLQIGPVDMQHRGDWQQRDSDLFAHFIQVNRQISQSRWNSADCTFTKSGERFTGGSFPDIEEFVYAAVYFRQLFARSRSDQLFKKTCERYIHFNGYIGKAAWVAEEQEGFAKTLAEPFFMLPGYSTEQLIEAFIYGASIFHGIPDDQCDKKRNFHEIIANHDRERVLYSLNGSLKMLQNHVSGVAAVLYQDFADWIPKYNLPLPDVIWHSSLFTCQPAS